MGEFEAVAQHDYPGGASVAGSIGDLSDGPTMLTGVLPVEGFPDGLTISWPMASDRRRIFRELAEALRHAAEAVEREAERSGLTLELVPPPPLPAPSIPMPSPPSPTMPVMPMPVMPVQPPGPPLDPLPGPTRWVSSVQLLQDQDDVRESVWRHLLQGEIHGPVFLSAPGMTAGSEPSDEILGRFRHGHGVPYNRRTGQPIEVHPFSRAIVTPEGVRHIETGELGVLLYAEAAGWESEAIAVVQGGYFVNAQSAGDYHFRLRGSGNLFRRAGTSDTWVIEEVRPIERKGKTESRS